MITILQSSKYYKKILEYIRENRHFQKHPLKLSTSIPDGLGSQRGYVREFGGANSTGGKPTYNPNIQPPFWLPNDEEFNFIIARRFTPVQKYRSCAFTLTYSIDGGFDCLLIFFDWLICIFRDWIWFFIIFLRKVAYIHIRNDVKSNRIMSLFNKFLSPVWYY